MLVQTRSEEHSLILKGLAIFGLFVVVVVVIVVVVVVVVVVAVVVSTVPTNFDCWIINAS